MLIQSSDIHNVIRNSLYITGFCLGVTAASYAVNKITHKLFGLQEGSTSSNIAKGMIVGMATLGSCYLSIRIDLRPFTGQQATAALLFGRYIQTVQASVLFGYLGSYTFIPLGRMSSTVGTCL